MSVQGIPEALFRLGLRSRLLPALLCPYLSKRPLRLGPMTYLRIRNLRAKMRLSAGRAFGLYPLTPKRDPSNPKKSDQVQDSWLLAIRLKGRCVGVCWGAWLGSQVPSLRALEPLSMNCSW